MITCETQLAKADDLCRRVDGLSTDPEVKAVLRDLCELVRDEIRAGTPDI